MTSASAQAALKLAEDPTASLWEMVFCVPTQQKIALFKQRKRFSKKEHAELYMRMHSDSAPQGIHHALFKGTRAEIEALPGIMPFEELIDVVDDYGDGKMAHECEWIVLRYNPATKEISELVDDEEFAFSDKTKALACGRFISDHCLMLPNDAYRVIVSDRDRKRITLISPKCMTTVDGFEK